MSTKKANAAALSEFWSWFYLTAEAIALNPHDPALLAELDVRVQRLNPKLSWEIGPGLSKPWRLVISPSLNPDLAPLTGPQRWIFRARGLLTWHRWRIWLR